MFATRTLPLAAILLLAACAGVPPQQPAAKTLPHVVVQPSNKAPRIDSSGSILIFVPDLTRVERMPVFVPDSMIDRRMVWRGSTAPMRLKGYLTPKSDSAAVEMPAPNPSPR